METRTKFSREFKLVAVKMVKDRGVALVLDDALGSTDESRLQALGAVVRVASQNTKQS